MREAALSDSLNLLEILVSEKVFVFFVRELQAIGDEHSDVVAEGQTIFFQLYNMICVEFRNFKFKQSKFESKRVS